MSCICRLCLKSVNSKDEAISVNSSDNNGVAIATLVKTLVPELYLGLSANPIICSPCYDALRDAYSFRLQCLRSENLIGIYIRETHCTSVTIVLEEVVEYWRNVYKHSNRQTDVGRANLSEWFGVVQGCDEDGNIQKGPKPTEQQLSLNKNSEQQPSLNKTSQQPNEVNKVNDPPSTLIGHRQSPVVDEQVSSVDDIEETKKSKKEDSTIGSCGKVGADSNKTINKEEESRIFNIEEEAQKIARLCLAVDASEDNAANPTEIPIPFRMPAKTYIKKKTNEVTQSENSEEVSEEAIVDSDEARVSKNAEDNPQGLRIRLEPDRTFNDGIDVNSLMKELQKNETLQKLGFGDHETNIAENYILKRFIDKTDRSVNYALLPKSIYKNTKRKETSKSRNSSESKNSVDSSSQDLISELVEQDPSEVASPQDVSRENASPISLKAPIVPEETDEESLGIITFHSEPTPPEPSQEKPMPLIRVRPVSSLQKVRTLNHELFPKAAGEEKREAVSSSMIIPPLRFAQARGAATKSPVVLNSHVAGSSLNPSLLSRLSQSSTNEGPQLPGPPPVLTSVTTLKQTQSTTKLMAVTVDHARRMGINPLNLRKLRVVKPRKRLVRPPPLTPVSVNLGEQRDEVSLGASGVVKSNKEIVSARTLESRGAQELNEVSEDMEEEEMIDIKEEPLNYMEDESLNDLECLESISNDSADEWDGETTRSASETSLMDKMISDNLSSLIGSIPEEIEDEFDHPEYVHINNVSFEDLSKLVKESKIYRKQTEVENIEENSGIGYPLRLSKTIPSEKTSRQRPVLLPKPGRTHYDGTNRKLPMLLPKCGDESGRHTKYDFDPSYVPPRSRRRNRNAGKRLRLVPVDADGNEPPKAKRRRTMVKCVQKSAADPQKDQENVCVLFTNFTSEGDYINDHDYLINPYMRNNMYFVKRNVESCVCLLCDIIHPAKEHIEHMKMFHSTRCAICQLDFHNVFILNLHVRGHMYNCTECNVKVTYARYRHHAETHNRSVTLSNIDLPVDDMRYVTLDEVLSRPVSRQESVLKPNVLQSPKSDSSGAGLRRSRRLTRHKEYKPAEQEEEEACIYDKTTKSFITPTAKKQQKLLEKCRARNKDTKTNEVVDKEDRSTDNQADPELAINLANLLRDSYNPIIATNVTSSDRSQEGKEGTVSRKPVSKVVRKRKRCVFSKRPKRMRIKKNKVVNVKKCSDIVDTAIDVPEPTNSDSVKTEETKSEETRQPEGNVTKPEEHVNKCEENLRKHEDDAIKREEHIKNKPKRKITRSKKLLTESETSQTPVGSLGDLNSDTIGTSEEASTKNLSIRKRSPKFIPKISSNARKPSAVKTKRPPKNKNSNPMKKNPLATKKPPSQGKIVKTPPAYPKKKPPTKTETNKMSKLKQREKRLEMKVKKLQIEVNWLSKAKQIKSSAKSKETQSKAVVPRQDSSRASPKVAPTKARRKSLNIPRGDLKIKIKSIKLNPFVAGNRNVEKEDVGEASAIVKVVSVPKGDLKAKTSGKKRKRGPSSCEDFTAPPSAFKKSEKADVQDSPVIDTQTVQHPEHTDDTPKKEDTVTKRSSKKYAEEAVVSSSSGSSCDNLKLVEDFPAQLPTPEKSEEADVQDSRVVDTQASQQPEQPDDIPKKEDIIIECSSKKDAEKAVVSSSSGSRSSRSRGSLNLVEGLDIDAPTRIRKPRKPALQTPPTIAQDDTKDNITVLNSQSLQVMTVKPTKSSPAEEKLDETQTTAQKETPVQACPATESTSESTENSETK